MENKRKWCILSNYSSSQTVPCKTLSQFLVFNSSFLKTSCKRPPLKWSITEREMGHRYIQDEKECFINITWCKNGLHFDIIWITDRSSRSGRCWPQKWQPITHRASVCLSHLFVIWQVAGWLLESGVNLSVCLTPTWGQQSPVWWETQALCLNVTANLLSS